MSEISRLAGVFFEPTKTFQDIAVRPRFIAPMLLLIVVTTALTVLFSQRVGFERAVRQQIESSSRAQQATPEQREQMIQLYTRMAPIFAYGAVLLFTPITFLIVAGIFLGMAKGIMAAPVSFKQVFAVVAYGWMPHVIAAVLSIVVLLLKNPEDYRMENPLVFNPGALMDPATANKFVLSLATSLDLFVLWALVLMGIGLKAAGGRQLSKGSAMAAVFLPWGAYVLCKSALAMFR
jgi:hypothetical protein